MITTDSTYQLMREIYFRLHSSKFFSKVVANVLSSKFSIVQAESKVISIQAKHAKRGIILNFEIKHGIIVALPKIRSIKAGYKYLQTKFIKDISELESVMQLLRDTPNEDLGRAFLPSPHQFIVPFSRSDTKSLAVVNSSQLKEAMVVAVVTIDDAGKVTGSNISKPGAEPWFLVKCENQTNAVFYLITDGNIFHRTNRVSTQQLNGREEIYTSITKNNPHKTVNFDKFTMVDKALLEYAIDIWIKPSQK